MAKYRKIKGRISYNNWQNTITSFIPKIKFVEFTLITIK